MQRQDIKSVTRVGKLEKTKSQVIFNKIRREEIKVKRKEHSIHEQVSIEIKKIKVIDLKKTEETKAKKIKDEIIKKKHAEVNLFKTVESSWRE